MAASAFTQARFHGTVTTCVQLPLRRYKALKVLAVARSASRPSVHGFDWNDDDQCERVAAAGRQPANRPLWDCRRRRAFLLALATFLVFASFTPIIPTATVVLILMVGDGLVDGRSSSFSFLSSSHACEQRVGPRGRAHSCTAGRRPVFAGRRDPGDRRRRDCRCGVGRVGDQSAIHERRRSLHHRSQSGHPALPPNLSVARCCAMFD